MPLDTLTILIAYMVFGKEVVWVGHGLKLQIVAGWVFKETGPLFTWGAFEAQMRLHDEVDPFVIQPSDGGSVVGSGGSVVGLAR